MTTSSKAAIDHAPAKFRTIIIDAAEAKTMGFHRLLTWTIADPGAQKIQMRVQATRHPLSSAITRLQCVLTYAKLRFCVARYSHCDFGTASPATLHAFFS
jgi:hypothetical protein